VTRLLILTFQQVGGRADSSGTCRENIFTNFRPEFEIFISRIMIPCLSRFESLETCRPLEDVSLVKQ